jgi:uncharacterized protein YqjF (DUF2071 family)
MDERLAIFLIITIAIGAAVILVPIMALIRARYRVHGQQTEGTVTLLKDQNEVLKEQVARLEKRLLVLERIATDPAERTAREIEQLRQA